MDLLFTCREAREFAENSKLEEWIHRFLCGDGNNIEFSEGLKKEKRSYIGPIKMPTHLFERCCGPEESMKYKIDKGGFEWRVSKIRNRMECGWDMPPLIINFSDNVFELNDGNHRYEAIVSSGLTECEVIIWTTGEADYQQFMESYSDILNETR